MGFKDSYTVDLQVGDLLIMSPGQIHGVYSPQNAFLVGTHFIIAEILVSTLKAATRHREYDGVTNDESKRAREYFINLIDVLAFFILSNLKLTKIFVTQTTRRSAVWGYWNYLLECLEVRVKWNMSKAKILRAKKHLTDLFGEELKNLP